MEWIKKDKEEEANNLIKKFLEEAKKYGSTAQTLYNDFCNRNFASNNSNESYKKQILDKVLLPEQNYKCCYCMKDISKTSTIEHIIPQTLDSNNNEEFNFYFNTKAKKLNNNNVCSTIDYINKGFSILPSYPHKVAYHNIVAVCSTCNNNRGSKKIEPLFLYENIRNEVNYDESSGEMMWTNDAYNTIDNVCLNREELKFIRAICFHLKRNKQSVKITQEERDNVVNNVFGEAGISDLKKLTTWKTAFAWNKLKDYNYFLE